MADNSASLLTKTQRNRIRNDFADLDEAKKHRDQQRIRERVRSGLLDFELLADYPDRQFALMFDDVPDDELRAALADTTIVVERLCERYDIDRAALIEDVRAHVEKDRDTTDDTRTLEQVELRTMAEIRRQVEDDLAEQFEPGRWDRRASALMKLGASTAILTVLGNLLYSTVTGGVIRSMLRSLLGVVVFLLFVSAIGWLLINTAQLLKYRIVPFVAELTNDPEAALRETANTFVKNPWETVRDSWEEL